MKANKILVPVNGSRADEEALNLAISLARRHKTRVYVVYVIEVNRTLPLDATVEPEIRRGEGLLEWAEKFADDIDYEVETELLQGREAGPTVVDEAIERGVDIIIMGIPYKKRFGEFDLGRTTPYLLKHAPCRVWICRETLC